MKMKFTERHFDQKMRFIFLMNGQDFITNGGDFISNGRDFHDEWSRVS